MTKSEFFSEIATAGGAGAFIGLVLHYFFGFANDPTLAGFAAALLLIAIWGLTFLFRWLRSMWQNASGQPAIGIDISGFLGDMLFTFIVGAFSLLGYFSFPFLTTGSEAKLTKPASIEINSQDFADKAIVHPALVPYSNWLSETAEGKPIYVVNSNPLDGPTPKFKWTLGPPLVIDSAFAFVVPPDNDSPIYILDLPQGDVSGEFEVEVPALPSGRYQIVVLVRAMSNEKLYSGGVK